MNHEWMKDQVFALYDQRLPDDAARMIQAHLDGCSECRDVLENWKKSSRAVLQPLQLPHSDLFVRRVMSRVQAFSQKDEERIRWGAFIRWAVPALALSAAGFTLGVVSTTESATISTEGLLWGDQEQNLTAEWFSHPPTEDQILNAAVARP